MGLMTMILLQGCMLMLDIIQVPLIAKHWWEQTLVFHIIADGMYHHVQVHVQVVHELHPTYVPINLHAMAPILCA